MIWITIAACFLISFTFSGIESGVLSVNRVRLRHHAMRGEQAAIALDGLLLRIERLMITVVLITNAANVLAVALLFSKFTEWFGRLGGLVTLLAALPVFIVLLEFLPKAIFQRFPYRTLAIFARILTAAHWVIGPVVGAGAWLVRPLLRRTREPRSGRIVAFEDLKRVTTESAQRGEMTENERFFIHNIVDFRTVKAAEVMTPLDNVASVRPDTRVAELLETARVSDTDRFPMIDDVGAFTGIVRVFDLLLDGARAGRAQSYVRRVVVVKPRDRAMDVLRKLRAARMPLALVADETGRPVGTLSSETLVRRLLTAAQ